MMFLPTTDRGALAARQQVNVYDRGGVVVPAYDGFIAVHLADWPPTTEPLGILTRPEDWAPDARHLLWSELARRERA